MPVDAASNMPREPDGLDYEITAAITKLRGQWFGEDFAAFMVSGATQRASLRFYVDLFSFQPPDLRCDAGPYSFNIERICSSLIRRLHRVYV